MRKLAASPLSCSSKLYQVNFVLKVGFQDQKKTVNTPSAAVPWTLPFHQDHTFGLIHDTHFCSSSTLLLHTNSLYTLSCGIVMIG